MARFWRAVLVIGLAAGVTFGAGSVPPAAEAVQEGMQYSEQVDISEFVPAPGSEEQVSAPLMVTLAYGFIWLLVMGFLYAMWRRGRALSMEMEAARQRLDELDGKLAQHLGRGAGGDGQ